MRPITILIIWRHLMKKITAKLLNRLYHEQNKSWTEIEKLLNLSTGTLRYWRKKLNIKSRENTFNTNVAIDLVNQKFGKLLVLERLPSLKGGHARWKCLCDCGNTHETTSSQLRRKSIISCGCERHLAGKRSKKWKGYGDISGSYWYLIIHRAKRFNREISITIEQAWNMFLTQNKKCYLTGLPLTFTNNYRNSKKEQTASLDRIDSSKGYTIDNVCWIHKDIQPMKMDLNLKDFISYCKLIVNNSININPAYLE